MWLVLVDDLHFIDGAMATVATHPAVHVNSVVEIGVVRNLVDTDPVDGLTGLPTLTHWGELWAVGFDLGVAGHTGLRGRHIRVRGDLNEAMTIPAIHPELLHVDDVREWHGLGGLVADAGVLRGEIIGQPAGDHRHYRAYTDHQLQGKPVRPFWKKIRHVFRASASTIHSKKTCLDSSTVKLSRGGNNLLGKLRDGKLSDTCFFEVLYVLKIFLFCQQFRHKLFCKVDSCARRDRTRDGFCKRLGTD